MAGIAGQVADDHWQTRMTDDEQTDLADLFGVATERARFTRAVAPDLSSPEQLGHSAQSPAQNPALKDPWLPLNRKERYYTGTVLPMLVASDGFAHLHRLLELCGLPGVRIDAFGSLDRDHDIAFYTEYSFAESVFTAADKRAWPDLTTADTPDVVIAGPDWLVALEAKMFHNPSATSLNRQMERQGVLVDYWATTRGLDPRRVRHVLLLPAPLRDKVGPLNHDVVTWEEIHDRYRRVAPRHWVQLLGTAVARHAELQSRTGGGKNADDVLSGASIVEQHAAGTLDYDHVGRNGGRTGKFFSADVATGNWRTVRYEVRRGPLPGKRNWFPIAQFLADTASTAESLTTPEDTP